MPYARNADLPAAVRDALPAEAQTVFRRALNAALETYGGDEERAFRVAWAAVRKAGWERGADGTWRRRPVRTEGSMPEQEMGEARPGFQPKFIFGRPNPRYRAGADEEEPRDEERGRNPDEFLVRPEEVKRLRQLARDGGMDDEAFAGAIRAMRRALRQTGELRFPPELRRAIEKATTEEEARDLEAALRRAATRRLRQRQAEAAEEDMPYWLYDDDPAIEEMGATEAIAKATLALGEAPRTFTSEERERYAEEGIALPDGSFPIPDLDALRRAIRAWGRAVAAGKAAQVKRHLLKRARALGAPDELIERIQALAEAEATTDTQASEAHQSSLDERVVRVRRAWDALPSPPVPVEGPAWEKPYVKEVFEDHVIVCQGDRHWRIPYTEDESYQVTFDLGSAEPVEQEWVAVEADDAASLVRPIAEAKDAEPDGSRWEVVIIRAGRSRNDRVYPEAVLREAAPLFEGARVLARSDEDHIAGRGKSVEKLVGWLSEVRYERGALRGVLTILESAGWLRTMLLDAWRRGKRDLVGLSIVAEGRGRRVLEGGRELVEVEAITKVSSVDVVFEPAAGGGFVKLVAAVGKEDDPMLEKLIELLRAAKPEVARELLREADEELVSQLKEAAPDLAAKIDEARAPEPPRSEPSAPERAEPEPEDLVPATIGRFVVREALAETKLPEVVQAKIRRRFEGRAFREGELREAIRDELETFAELEKAGLVQPAERDSEPAGRVTLDEATKVKAALDGFFLGEDVEVEGSKVPRFRSFREAYVQLTGDEHITGRLPQDPRGKLGLSEADAGRVRIPRLVWDPETQAFSEAVLSSTFDQILGDSITRAMLREYAASNLRIWEPLVDVVPVRDFRTQRRMRFGGYPNLPTVAQNAAYAALTTPTDEEATYAVAKRGGTETITIEAISNDDVGAIRRIPQRLARAAAQTLHEFVLDFLATNPTIYDSVALFAAGHNNLGSTALSAASLKAARARMRKQTDMSSGKRLGLAARYLWVPVDLEDVAFEILEAPGKPGTADNDANFLRGQFQTVVVDYWTDANNWFLTASKDQVPLIELGFWGPEEPELFTQDLPTVGEMFSNDRLVYKIRHTYGGAVMDFRGFDGSIVA